MRSLGGLLLVMALALPTLASALPVPVPPGNAATSPGFASPYEAAFDAVDRLIGPDTRIPDYRGSSSFFTRDQMLGILVEVRRASLFPARAGEALADARRLWNAAEDSYHKSTKFYDVTLTTAAVCIHLEANAWALLAADRLGEATGDAGIKTRAAELTQTLASAVASGTSDGVPRCGPVPSSQWPLPLYALLRRVETTGGSPAAKAAALNQLDVEIRDRLREGGFQDASGLYLAVPNAQYLLVLQAAERVQTGAYAARRDALNGFLAQRIVSLSDGPAARTLQSDGRTPLGGIDPEAQAWTAVALHQQRSLLPSDRPDLPERLFDALVARSWSTAEGGFTVEAGQLSGLYNLLTALFTSGPVVTQVSSDAARVAIVVPAAGEFTYPKPGERGAEKLLISNEWTFRFVLDPLGPSTQAVLLPLSRLGALHHPFPLSAYAPAPTLQRAGNAVPVESVGDAYPLLRFTMPLQPASSLRLVDYAPLLPVSSEVRRDVRVFVSANASQPIALDLLRLDLAMRNITVQSVRFNDRLLAAEEYDVADVAPTDFLPLSHVRVELRSVSTRLDLLNEVFISYSDPERPVLGAPRLSADAAGDTPLARGGNDAPYKISTRNRGYVHVEARDNAALKSVALVVGQGLNVTEVPMELVSGTLDTYRGHLPPIAVSNPVQVQIRAVDEHDLLAESERFEVQAQPPFLQVGSPILLVFSATLLLAAIGVWFKMGRKRRK